MKSRPRTIHIWLITMGVLGGGLASSAPAGAAGRHAGPAALPMPGSSTPEETERAVRTRRAFGGLDTSQAAIEKAVAESKGQPDPRVEITLRRSEVLEFHRRDGVLQRMRGASARQKSVAAGRFGGVHLDQESGGKVVVWLAEPNAADLRLLATLYGESTDFTIKHADFSVEQLAKDEAALDSARLAEEDLDRALVVTGTSIDRNRVDVSVAAGTTQRVLARIRALGPSINVVGIGS